MLLRDIRVKSGRTSDIKISDKQDGYTIRIEFLCTEER